MLRSYRDETEWDAACLTMQAFYDANDVDGIIDDSILAFASNEFEGIGYADRGAPLSYQSEWQAYMLENDSNF